MRGRTVVVGRVDLSLLDIVKEALEVVLPLLTGRVSLPVRLVPARPSSRTQSSVHRPSVDGTGVVQAVAHLRVAERRLTRRREIGQVLGVVVKVRVDVDRS